MVRVTRRLAERDGCPREACRDLLFNVSRLICVGFPIEVCVLMFGRVGFPIEVCVLMFGF